MHPTSKLVLGSVQFGLNYGINNSGGIVSEEDVQKIIAECEKRGIRYIDTAHAYGNSEKVLGKHIPKKESFFKLVSKVPSDTNPENFLTYINSSLSNLESDHIYAILFHDFESFKRRHKELLPQCHELVEQGTIEKFGFSLYDEEQLLWLIENEIEPQILQVPYSVLDKRFEKLISRVSKDYKTEIHVRSVFLQGLYFKEVETLTGNFSEFKEPIEAMRQFSADHNIDYISFLLAHPILNEDIDGVLVGVDSYKQFQELLEAVDKLDSEAINFTYKFESRELLNPANWKT